MKPYDEIVKAIEHSQCITHLDITEKMLEDRKEFLSVEDYNQLTEVINLKKKIWTS